ncbi:hypothetical protein ACIN8IBEIGE_100015 [Acinetobacter sp. 8I-beige]|nr:hypothetical protein ACIN8IBEIGE_100015 [Acinetobacter sp. 8I-beige]
MTFPVGTEVQPTKAKVMSVAPKIFFIKLTFLYINHKSVYTICYTLSLKVCFTFALHKWSFTLYKRTFIHLK